MDFKLTNKTLSSKKRFFTSIFFSFFIFLSSVLFFILYNSRFDNNNFHYRTPGISYLGLTVISETNSWNNIKNKDYKLVAGKSILSTFKSISDNLGIIAVPFKTNYRKINDRILFRIREKGENDWYYQRIYDASQIVDGVPFPFGFPLIENSKNLTYEFEIKSLRGTVQESLVISKDAPIFIERYKFSVNNLLKSPKELIEFIFLKYETGLDSLNTFEWIFIFLLSAVPLFRILINKKEIKSSIDKIENKISLYKNIYWIIPVLTILVYNLTFYNKYFPITEGWFSVYAWLINHGQFPYRDFYLFLTPLYPIIISLFTLVFGYQLIFLRIFGILIILLMTFFLYKNMELLFGEKIASFISIVGIIYYQSGVAHITYDFTQFVALFGLIQAYFLLKYFKEKEFKKINRKLIFLSGFFAALTFLIKQSNGLMMTVFPFIGLVLLSFRDGWKSLLTIIKSYVAGFILPVLFILTWIFLNSAFTQFISQVFIDAAAAKGGGIQVLTGWIKENFKLDFLRRVFEIIVVFLLLGYWINLGKKIKENALISNLLLLGGSLGIIVIIMLAALGRIYFLNAHFRFAQNAIGNLTVAAIVVSILLILLYFSNQKNKNIISKELAIISFVSLGYIFGTGTSGGLSEAGAFLGVAIFMGILLKIPSPFYIGKIFIILIALSISFLYIEIKYERPYYWWGLTSGGDIRGKLVTTDKIPVLKGIYSSPYNMKMIEEIVQVINSYSNKNDILINFPNIPTFNLYTNREFPGKAILYWFDFLPDKFAIQEADLIIQKQPKVIVYLDMGPEVWRAHEAAFRSGKPSNQRAIDKAIKQIIEKYRMKKIKNYQLENGVFLYVWVINKTI